jgi:thioredoxin 1
MNQEADKVIELDAASFEREVGSAAMPVLVDFYTPGCGPCRMMSPILDELVKERNGSLKVVKVDASEHRELAARFRISAIPTFVLFDKGQVQRQITGSRAKKAFVSWLDGQN